MQGRPSVTVSIQGNKVEYLLDTGARINVMSLSCFNKLRDVNLEMSDEILRCANNSTLEIVGKVRTGVIIDQVCKEITFLVAERVTPDLIGGIDMQRNFGYQLMQKVDSKTYDKVENYICNIEANFG